MFDIDYMVPDNVDEAISILTRQPHARIIAGGTDLLVQMRHRIQEPELIVDIGRLPFNTIAQQGQKIVIGSNVTHTQIARSDLLRHHFPSLVRASELVGGPSIRNRATLGGNLVNASPAADTIPPLLAHDAEAVIVGKNGHRTILLKKFYTDYRQTQLATGEILQAIQLPLPPSNTAAHFIKYGNRRSLYIAVLNVAVRISVSDADVVECARIALGCVGPTVFLVSDAEIALQGRPLGKKSIAMAAEIAQEIAAPISDLRASANYRSNLVAVLVRRALMQVAASLDLRN